MSKQVVALEVTADSSNADKSIKQLKAEIQATTEEVAKLGQKYGESSEEAIAANRKLAQLQQQTNDKIEQQNQKIDDAARTVSALSAVYGGLQGALELTGMAGEDTIKQLAKIQSALAIGDAIQNMAEFRNSIVNTFKTLGKQASDAFKAIKAGIGSSGIGALLLLLGAILVYWDDIKEAVSGVSAEQKKLLETQKQSALISKNALDDISKQENLLKLQGKTQKEILDMKIAASDKSIKDFEAVLETQKATRNIQIDTAKRNKNILEGIIKFVSIPLTQILEAVDSAGKVLGQDFGLAKGYLNKVSSLVFDPEQVKNDADKAIEESTNTLKKLKNDQAGFKLEIKELDKKSANDSKKTNDDKNKDIIEANKKANEDILKLQQENTLASIADERKRAELKLEIDLENAKKIVENSKASEELKQKEIQALEQKYMLDLRALQDKNAEEDKKKADEKAKADIAKEAETNKMLTDARINAIKDEAVKRQEIEAQRYQDEVDKQLELLNTKQITDDEYKLRREAIEQQHQTNLTAIEKQNADERVKTAQAEYQAKVSLYQQTGDAMGQLADVIGKTTGVGKALAIGQIAIDTGVAISALTRNSEANPANAATFGAAGAIQFATGIIRILANIKKAKEILSQAKVPGAGNPNPSTTPPPTVSAPIAPQMSQTALNQQMVNQMGNAATRAFVLESDVSGNQERIRRLNRAARIN